MRRRILLNLRPEEVFDIFYGGIKECICVNMCEVQDLPVEVYIYCRSIDMSKNTDMRCTRIKKRGWFGKVVGRFWLKQYERVGNKDIWKVENLRRYKRACKIRVMYVRNRAKSFAFTKSWFIRITKVPRRWCYIYRIEYKPKRKVNREKESV